MMCQRNGSLPSAQGLYDPRLERDACGIGFVANIKGQRTHDIVSKGIQILINLNHRGACGCDPETGDGAGLLIQIPHAYFEAECAGQGFTLPPAGEYGVGRRWLPTRQDARLAWEGHLERIALERVPRNLLSSRFFFGVPGKCLRMTWNASCTL